MTQSDIRVLIVEDEEIWAKAISMDLEDFGYSVAGIASTFDEAVIMLKDADTYDLALVDIRLNGRNMGIEAGRLINTLYKKPFIFMTATHGLHSFEAVHEVQPSAYLTKPVNPSSLVIAIQNALNNFTEKIAAIGNKEPENKEHFFFIKNGNKYKKIVWENVVHLRADKNYTYFLNSTDKGAYPVRSSLSKTYEFLVPADLKSRFVQINRSDIIQLPYVTELAGSEIITLYGNYTCSDMYIKDIKRLLHIVT